LVIVIITSKILKIESCSINLEKKIKNNKVELNTNNKLLKKKFFKISHLINEISLHQLIKINNTKTKYEKGSLTFKELKIK
jgi:dynactin complex subunit